MTHLTEIMDIQKADDRKFNELLTPETEHKYVTNKLIARNVDVFYGELHALKNVSMNFPENSVTAFIGPSGCGKSTFLRLFNRMNDYIRDFRICMKFW